MAAGVGFGVYGFVSSPEQLGQTRAAGPTGPVEPLTEEPESDFSDLLGMRFQIAAPPKPVEDDNTQNEQPEVVTVPPPSIQLLNIIRDPKGSIVCIQNAANERKSAFVGDRVFNVLIKSIDYEAGKICVVSQNKDFWISMAEPAQPDR